MPRRIATSAAPSRTWAARPRHGGASNAPSPVRNGRKTPRRSRNEAAPRGPRRRSDRREMVGGENVFRVGVWLDYGRQLKADSGLGVFARELMRGFLQLQEPI